ncbi:hypothetical protein [Bacteroides sp.]|uniref:hypothetical protein n=1 Tax=Bacteroides sp. TaxID=29523 RepID=UPI003A9333B3
MNLFKDMNKAEATFALAEIASALLPLTKAELYSPISKILEKNGVGFSVKDWIAGLFQSEDKDKRIIQEFGSDFSEARDFGIDICIEAAKEKFSPEVIQHWADMSSDEHERICRMYAADVADAFELKAYKGILFEEMDGFTLGTNNGDGFIHLNFKMLSAMETPLKLVDTITHELRHQYQSECVQRLHDVSEEVIKEWTKGYEIYTTDQPWAYDPWGYQYNPLEIDARYAGESVIRGMTKDFINENIHAWNGNNK